MHPGATDGRRAVMTAGYAYGSLVAVVAFADIGAAQLQCTATPALDAAVNQLTSLLGPSGDASRVIVPPVIIEQPNTLVPIIVPPVDPSPDLMP
jgi:hypothetical protein